jgi:hypothetical protein
LIELEYKDNSRRDLTAEEAKRLNKLEAIADKLKHGENVQSGDVVTHALQVITKILILNRNN